MEYEDLNNLECPECERLLEYMGLIETSYIGLSEEYRCHTCNESFYFRVDN